MESIIYSSSQADMVNTEAAKNLCHHIVIVSHYNPESYFISSDAIYLAGIQNLYKFLIDAGVAHKLPEIRNVTNINQRFTRNRDIVQTLRTKTCHNKNETNDTVMVEKRYAEWIKSVINKEKPENISDFDLLRVELSKIGQELVDDILKFIQDNAGSSREKVVSAIEELWLNYYCNSSGRETIRKQLWDYYVVKEPNVYANLSWKDKNRKLKSWCEKLYCAEELRDIDKYDNIIRVYGATLKKADLFSIQEKLKKSKAEYEKKKVDAENNGGFCEKYIGEMVEVKIKSEIQEIRKDLSRTLVPEDLIQNIIAKDFGNL